MRTDRLIVGLLCIVFAVWTFLSHNPTGPAFGIGILGIIILAITRGKRLRQPRAVCLPNTAFKLS
jgi:hypothetical protein